MSFLMYIKIREVRKILEEWFFNISETGVSAVRHTRRQGKKQVSAVTSVLREGRCNCLGESMSIFKSFNILVVYIDVFPL